MAVAWDPKLSVGIERLDRQHQRWIELMNELFTALHDGKGNELLETTFRNVTEYTETHFRDEETMLKAACYPRYAEHKAEHDGFVAELRELRQSHIEGTALLSVVVAKKLTGWFFQHIGHSDQDYAPHLATKPSP